MGADAFTGIGSAHNGVMTQGRTGRRAGNPDTRGEIIDAAAEAFIAHGYDGASVRGVARAAGVDPALIHRWFGGKEGLLLAVVKIKFDIDGVIAAVVANGQGELAHRALTMVVTIWESPMGRTVIDIMRRRPALLPVLASFLRARYSAAAIALGIPRREAELRSAIAVSQVMGLANARYLARIEPLASLPPDEVVRLYTPLLHHVLTSPTIKTHRQP